MIPQFYYDEKHEHVYWCCPHMEAFSSLPNVLWHVESIHPLTVDRSIHNSHCGCHGWIKAGKWVSS
jgi:hypothetical protein